MHSGVIFKEKRKWDVEKGRLAAGEVGQEGAGVVLGLPLDLGGLSVRGCTEPPLLAFLFRSCGCKPSLSQFQGCPHPCSPPFPAARGQLCQRVGTALPCDGETVSG